MLNITYENLAPHNRPAAGGKSAPEKILTGVKTHALLMALDVSVSIAGGDGAGTVNAESTSRLIRGITLKEAGKPRFELDGRILAYLTSRAQRQAANIAVMASGAVQGPILLHADYVLDFANIYGADPGETAFVELNPNYPTTIEVDWEPLAQAAILTGGTSVLTINSATLSVVQMFDERSQLPPFFLPRITKTTSRAIAGVQAEFDIPLQLERQARLESLIAHSVIDGATASSILTGQVTLRGDKYRYINGVDRRTLLNEARRFFSVPVPSLGYLELNQRFYGKLSEMLIGNQDESIRLNAHVTGSGTVATIDVFKLEKHVEPGFTRALPATW